LEGVGPIKPPPFRLPPESQVPTQVTLFVQLLARQLEGSGVLKVSMRNGPRGEIFYACETRTLEFRGKAIELGSYSFEWGIVLAGFVGELVFEISWNGRLLGTCVSRVAAPDEDVVLIRNNPVTVIAEPAAA
jgi:hypothetical protein